MYTLTLKIPCPVVHHAPRVSYFVPCAAAARRRSRLLGFGSTFNTEPRLLERAVDVGREGRLGEQAEQCDQVGHRVAREQQCLFGLTALYRVWCRGRVRVCVLPGLLGRGCGFYWRRRVFRVYRLELATGLRDDCTPRQNFVQVRRRFIRWNIPRLIRA